ncbi:MAG: response regulator [Nitrospira sp.]|nr:response regulator [Nitrospira sp.]
MPDRLAQSLTTETPMVSCEEQSELLSQEHTILERPVMMFRPFGKDEQGNNIADVSGTLVVSAIEYLETCVEKSRGSAAAAHSVEKLCRLLNDRIPDPSYYVTPALLRTEWNSYSYEFLSYLREFCQQLSGDPQFHYNTGLTRVISPLFRILARPFTLAQFSKLALYWAQRYTQGTVECEVAEVTDCSMIYRLRFTDHTLKQFGPYRKACVHQVCASTKGRMVSAPPLVHGSPPATVKDRTCMVNGDPWCEWEVRWQPNASPTYWSIWTFVPGILAWLCLQYFYPTTPPLAALLCILLPTFVAGIMADTRYRSTTRKRDALIQEQTQFVEARYAELRDAYMEQEQTRVELRRKVQHLTALHRAGLSFGGTLDRETLMQTVLQTLIHELHYDRAMISSYDPVRHTLHSGRIVGVSEEIQAFVRNREVPVSESDGFPGSALHIDKPMLIADIKTIWEDLHPENRKLATWTGTRSLIWVPLKVKSRILGALTVDRTTPNSLTSDDLELMETVSNQVAIALDNASAYTQIEELNIGLESKVRERTAELERADRTRSSFLSHVSHELRTPLTSIKGFVENLLDGVTGPVNSKQRHYLDRINENVKRLMRMIGDLLDRTRIETGQLALSPAEVDLERCVGEVLEHLRPLALEKRQILSCQYPLSTLIVWVDRDRLIQILTNLVHNAIKFTPAEGRIDVVVEASDSAFATIHVRDSGPGIAREALEQIFDPFFRTAGGRKTCRQGLGLGLSIVKTLVELHNGRIEVRSEPGHGAEFSVMLPLIPSAPLAKTSGARSSKRVLIVDDDPDIRQLLVDRLMAEGYDTEQAVDGVQALKTLQSGEFGGVLLDIGLPQLDGLEVLRQVRRWNQQIPIVVVTAAQSKDLAVRAISLGAQAYMLKPFDISELHQIVQSWFAQDSAQTMPTT